MSITAFIVRFEASCVDRESGDRAVTSFLEKLTEQPAFQIRVGTARVDYSSVYPDENVGAIATGTDRRDPTVCRTVVFDGWLENRTELINELPGYDLNSESNDSAIVLASIAQWGEKAADRLYGEYSFVALSRRTFSDVPDIFAVRDKVGVRSLFVSNAGHSVGFSNFAGALSVLPWVGSAVNEGYAAEFLCVEVNSIKETLYSRVSRIPGGELATWSDADGFHTTRYWKPHSQIMRQDEQQAAFQLRRTLDRVVAAAARSGFPVGAQISGGIDSSTVACVLAGLVNRGVLRADLIAGMSQVYPGLPCDESHYIDALEPTLPFRIEKLLPTYASAPLLGEWTRRLRYPVFSFASTASLNHDRNHRTRGGRIVLTGEGGDELFMPCVTPRERLSSLAGLSWTIRAARATYSANGGRINIRGRLYCVIDSMLPLALRNGLNRLQRRRKRWSAAIDEQWCARVRIDKRLDRLTVPSQPRTVALEQTLSGSLGYLFEHAFEMNFLSGIEKRYPLLSASVLEFVECLPLASLDVPGVRNRVLLRQSVRDLLPAKIFGRQSKSEFTPSVLPALLDVAKVRFGEEFDCPSLGQFGRSTLRSNAISHVWRLDAAQTYAGWVESI